MKLIIDIDDKDILFDIKNRGFEPQTETDKIIINALYNGKPYEKTQGDLISREALRNFLLDSRPDDLQQSDINFLTGDIKVSLKFVLKIIDNAPTVEPHYVSDLPDDVVKTLQTLAIDYSDGIAIFERKRPKGECKSCRHRDPEDKKCDCGALERQGCPFSVSDDYYCKYYEKGGAE
jgi:hypothetical protein